MDNDWFFPSSLFPSASVIWDFPQLLQCHDPPFFGKFFRTLAPVSENIWQTLALSQLPPPTPQPRHPQLCFEEPHFSTSKHFSYTWLFRNSRRKKRNEYQLEGLQKSQCGQKNPRTLQVVSSTQVPDWKDASVF